MTLSLVAPKLGGFLQAPSIKVGAQSQSIIINHNHVNATLIPQDSLDTARNLDIFFSHKSVGYNILTGLDELSASDSSRYSLTRVSNPVMTWYDTHSGLGDFSFGSNTLPETKINGFDSAIRSGYGNHLGIGLMKFCYVDFAGGGASSIYTGQYVWDLYRPMIEALQQDYPNVTFVWFTAAITTSGGNRERETFNTLLRQYVSENGGILFDLAAIESHDPQGRAIYDSSGYEAMYSSYSNDGGHLNATGRQRVASAWWWMMARLAGWDGGTNNCSRSDLNDDCLVNHHDVNVLLSNWVVATSASSLADFNRDSRVNGLDFSALIREWIIN
jgi:hypothetical protein